MLPRQTRIGQPGSKSNQSQLKGYRVRTLSVGLDRGDKFVDAEARPIPMASDLNGIGT
jgi:hypothetical protein